MLYILRDGLGVRIDPVVGKVHDADGLPMIRDLCPDPATLSLSLSGVALHFAHMEQLNNHVPAVGLKQVLIFTGCSLVIF